MITWLQITYDNIQKIETGQGDDYTTVCLLDCLYFKEHYKLIVIDLKELQICNRKLILCPPQDKQKDNQHSKLLVFK